MLPLGDLQGRGPGAAWTETWTAQIVGVIAAGIEYGAYTRYVVTYGERMRMAASYVRPCARMLRTLASGPAALPHTRAQSRLCCRGATGSIAQT